MTDLYRVQIQEDLRSIVLALTNMETDPALFDKLQSRFTDKESPINLTATRDGKFSQDGCIARVKINGSYQFVRTIGSAVVNQQVFVQTYPTIPPKKWDDAKPTYAWVNVEDFHHAYRMD